MSLIPRCRSCGRDLDRHPHEGLVAYRARRICSMSDCTGKGEIAPDYPGAIRVAMVPAVCPRCGGLWRRVPDGVICRQCGRSIAVVEALMALAGRGAGQWPVVRPLAIR